MEVFLCYSWSPRAWKMVSCLERSFCFGWIWWEVCLYETRRKWCDFNHRRRQHQCTQAQTEETRQGSFSIMSCSWCNISLVIPIFVLYILASSSVFPAYSLAAGGQQHETSTNQTLRPQEELHKLKMIRAHLNKLNKPAIKTIQACILLCLQCSFFFFFILI